MRPSNKPRSRNKPNNNGNQNQRRSVGNIINRVFDSAGPDGKVRGTPQQIIDKYNVLARDAQLSGDRVAAENYLQHAEHYSRLLGDAQRQAQEQRQAQDQQRDSTRRDDGQRRPNGQENDASDQSDDSGLATFDPREMDDASGPVETPESRHQTAGDSNRSEEARETGKETGSRRQRAARAEEAARNAADSAARDDEASESSGPVNEETSAAPAEQGAGEEKPAPKKRTRRKPRAKDDEGEEGTENSSAQTETSADAGGRTDPQPSQPSEQVAQSEAAGSGEEKVPAQQAAAD
jgi:hypothetical protein